MPIPDEQLQVWSHQGSIAQSRDTYNAVKRVLEAAGTPYAGHAYSVFLQGSYGNDTNIYAESDVDIVIALNSTFHRDLEALPQDQKDAYLLAYEDATYTYAEFKRDVLKVLNDAYRQDVDPGDKAIAIAANGGRRKSDVIAATKYRRYHRFRVIGDEDYDEGICFWNKAGVQIANYPKQHSTNCTQKHQATKNRFKPMARVLKNMRGRMIAKGLLDAGIASSYYLEGLLYNVPDDKFVASLSDTFVNTYNWLIEADRSKFVCANEQYYLLRPGEQVTWRAEKCQTFLNAARTFWETW